MLLSILYFLYPIIYFISTDILNCKQRSKWVKHGALTTLSRDPLSARVREHRQIKSTASQIKLFITVSNKSLTNVI